MNLRYTNEKDKNLDLEKEKTRRRHLLARDVQLKESTVVDFIQGMEKRKLTTKGWHSIFSVMRDGGELQKQILQVRLENFEETKIDALSKIIKPYIQIVEQNLKCEQTGLLFSLIFIGGYAPTYLD